MGNKVIQFFGSLQMKSNQTILIVRFKSQQNNKRDGKHDRKRDKMV